MPQRHPDADTTCVFFSKRIFFCKIQKKNQRKHVAQRRTPSSLCGLFLFYFFYFFYFFWHLPVLLANSLRRNAAEEELFVAERVQRRRFGGRAAAASAAACAEVGNDSGALLRARQRALLRAQTVGQGVGVFGGAVEFAHLLQVERGDRQVEADAVRA
jgi:hypothetical protein